MEFIALIILMILILFLLRKKINIFFKVVSFRAILAVNVILTILSFYPLIIALLFIEGLFVESTTTEKIIGSLIILTNFFVILGVNFILYKFVKNKKNLQIHSENILMKFAILMIVITLLIISFFVFPDFWWSLFGNL